MKPTINLNIIFPASTENKSLTSILEDRPVITDYDDYRLYLKDMFWNAKKEANNFSLVYCSNKLGVSKTYFKQIFDKRTHIHLNKVSATSKLFKLSKLESEYFLFLIITSQIDEPELKNYFNNLLGELKSNLSKVHQ